MELMVAFKNMLDLVGDVDKPGPDFLEKKLPG